MAMPGGQPTSPGFGAGITAQSPAQAQEVAAAPAPDPNEITVTADVPAPARGGTSSARGSGILGQAQGQDDGESDVRFPAGTTLTDGRMTLDPVTGRLMDNQGNFVLGNGMIGTGFGRFGDAALTMVPGGVLAQLASLGLTGRSIGSNFARGEPLTDPTVGIRGETTNVPGFTEGVPPTGSTSPSVSPTTSKTNQPSFDARVLAALLDPTDYGYGTAHRFYR
jgi:hypothetical protein